MSRRFCDWCGARLRTPKAVLAEVQRALDEATALTPPGATREEIWSAYCRLSARVLDALPLSADVCTPCVRSSRAVAHA